MQRHIIHLHIPAFPIAVEQVYHPELRDRPVAVAPAQSERGLILSASPKARNQGVTKGMPIGRAIKLCPDLTVLPPNPEILEKACQTLAMVVARYTPIWEESQPGHIYLDVTGTERLWGKARDTAYRLRKEVNGRLSLAGTVGVASNKMVSSIASIMPSEGVLTVDHGREASFMAPLKVAIVPCVGRLRRKILLEELNITRVWQLAKLDTSSLRIIFGRQAFVIHQRALGIDPTPVYPARVKPMVDEDITLPQDENDDRKLLGILYWLLEKCCHRLRNRALFPRKAGLLIRYSDHVVIKRQLKLPRLSFWDFDLYGPLEQLFFKACNRRVRVQYMKIWFWDFSPSSFQLPLFPQPSPDAEKKSLLIQALDRIRERHGEASIQYGKTA